MSALVVGSRFGERVVRGIHRDEKIHDTSARRVRGSIVRQHPTLTTTPSPGALTSSQDNEQLDSARHPLPELTQRIKPDPGGERDLSHNIRERIVTSRVPAS